MNVASKDQVIAKKVFKVFMESHDCAVVKRM